MSDEGELDFINIPIKGGFCTGLNLSAAGFIPVMCVTVECRHHHGYHGLLTGRQGVGLNLLPAEWEPSALPTELPGRILEYFQLK